MEGLMLKLKLQYFGHLMWRANSLEKTLMLGKIKGKRRRGQKGMVGWHHRLNGHESEQTPGNRGAWCAPVHGVGKSGTQLSDWTTVTNSESVWINKPWTILKEMGIPYHLICLLRNLYAGQEETFRTGHRTTDWFQIRKGVHQGCILSPCLFNLYV